MNRLKILLAAAGILACATLSAASVDATMERPFIDLAKVPDSAIVKGVVYLKFKADVSTHLDRTPLARGKNGNVRFGLSDVDGLNERHGVKRARLVFSKIDDRKDFLQKHRQAGLDRWYRLELDAGADIRATVEEYKALPGVESVAPDFKKKQVWTSASPSLPDDPRFGEQWNYHNTGQQLGTAGCDIRLPEAWALCRGNPGVIVAVIDGGINYNHPDLSANMWSSTGYNFSSGSATITPDGHASHVAGIIAAITNNGTGVSGIAGGSGPGMGDGVRLMSCQVFPNGTAANFAQAYRYAADNGAAISQSSWAYTYPGVYDPAVLDAIDYFNANGGGTVLNGGISIFAAGNSNTNGTWWPGCYSGVVSVAATNNKDKRAFYSNFDTWVDISAPGGEWSTYYDPKSILSTYTTASVDTQYQFLQGTSMACPHVSGVAALIISSAPAKALSNSDVRDLLLMSTDNHYALNPLFLGRLGCGRLNAYNALVKTAAYLAAAKVANPPVITASASGFTQINLSWTRNPGNDDVIIAVNTTPTFGTPVNGSVYTVDNALPGGGTILYAGSGTSFIHSSLSSGTWYFYRIWSKNGSNAYSLGKDVWARTDRSSVTSFPFSEGFENGSIPEAWTDLRQPGNYWAITTGNGLASPNNIPSAAHGGYRNASLFNPDSVVFDRDTLVTPALDLTKLTYSKLTFWHTQPRNGTKYQDTLKLYYKTSDNGSWNPLAVYSANLTTWTKDSIATLPCPSNRYYIGFAGIARYSFGICLDDIAIGAGTLSAPSLQATNVTFGNVLAYQMNVSWTKGNGSKRVVFIKQASSSSPSPGNNNTYSANSAYGAGSQILTSKWYCVYNDTGNSVTVTNLAASTPYRIMVCEYNGPSGSEKYFNSTVTTNPRNQTTAAPPPSAPTLSSPANGATNQAPTLALSWSAVTGAVTYRVQVAADAGFIAMAVDDSMVTGTSKTVGPLAAGTAYYWRVNAKNAGGSSAWSSTRNFTTITAVRKGPYLIYEGTNTAMTVLWQVNITAGCTIRWGLNQSYTGGSAQTVEYGTDHQHKYAITGLAPGTKYYYSIDGIGAGSFRTAPAADAQNVRIYDYGDCQDTVAVQAALQGRIVKEYVADPLLQTLCLRTGDWANTDDETNWGSLHFNRTYDTMVRFQSEVPFCGSRGNHESAGTVFRKYYPYTYAGGFYRSFDYGPAHIAIIDVYTDFTTGSAQYNWLQSDLASSTKQWKIVVLHEPGWSAYRLSGTGHANNTSVQTILQPLFKTNNVDMVITGHNHYYARARVQGIAHVTSGGGGSALYTPDPAQDSIVTVDKSQHYDRIDILGNVLTFTAVRKNGTTIETFQLTHPVPAAPVLATPANNAVNQQQSLSLAWNSVTGATGYRVQLSATADFAAPLVDVSQSATTKAVGPLAVATRYYWRVNARNTWCVSGWTVDSFTTVPAPPAVPAPVSPAGGLTGVSLTPTLHWSVAAGAASYRVQVAADAAFSVPLITDASALMTTSVTAGPLPSWCVHYYWRVGADNAGGFSGWSPAESFTANCPPVLASIGAKSVDEGATLSFTVSASDPDGTTPALSATGLPMGMGATFDAGVFSWTPSYDDQTGPYTVTFTATDGSLTTSETVTITVANVNRPPFLAAIGPKSAIEQELLTFTVSATDPDGTVPVITATGLPAGATFEAGTFSWTPGYDQGGAWSVTFMAADNELSVSETVVITVGDANRPPVLATIRDTAIAEGQPLSLAFAATDPDGTTPALSATGLPAGAVITDNHDGTASFAWTPSFDQAGAHAINIQADDGIATVEAVFTMTVTSTNRKPVISVLSSYSGIAGQAMSFTVTASDPDGQPVVLAAEGIPSGATFTLIGNALGEFSWAPLLADTGVYPVKFIADDGELKDSVTVNVVVLEKSLSEGLVGRWEFDEGSGTTANDGSGYWHNGVISGGATYSAEVPPVLAGRSTGSMRFDGVNGYVVTNNVGIYEDYTISAWIKATVPSASALGSVVNYGSRRGQLSIYKGNRVYFRLNALNNGTLTEFTTITIAIDEGWHHVAGVLMGDTMRLYVDGQFRAKRVKTGALQGAGNIQVGMENGTSFPYTGFVDDIRLYGRVLTNTEIMGLYSSDFKQLTGVTAGKDTTLHDVTLPLDLALNGAGIGVAGFQWRELSGSPNVSFISETQSLSTTARFSAIGTYEFELSAGEGDLKFYDTMTVTIAAVDLWTGIAGRWEFDEGSGTTANDGSGNWHNGVISGGAEYSAEVPPVLAGTSTGSMRFDGVNGYVATDNVGIYEDYTISAWIKATVPSASALGSVVNYGSRRGQLSIYKGNRVYFRLNALNNGTLTEFTTTTVIIDEGWHHVAGVLMGDTMRLYVDGQFRAKRVKTGALQGAGNIQVGMENGTSFPYTGFVDDIRLYGRVLTNTEIMGLYSSDFKQLTGVTAGKDTTLHDVTLPLDLALNGAGIGVAGFQWRELSGSPNVSFISETQSLSTTARFSAIGTYEFELSAGEGDLKFYDTMTVTIAAVDLWTGIAGRWEFDEGSGTTANDGSGNWHNGVISGGAEYSAEVPPVLAGTSTGSMRFDGVNGYVATDNVGIYEDYTISAWIKATVPSASALGSVVNYGSRRGQLSIYKGNRVYFRLNALNNGTLTEFTTTTVIIDEGWHHVAGVLMGDTMRLYVDGQFRAKRVKTGALQGAGNIQVGMENGTSFPYTGFVDDVRLYRRSLNATEIVALSIGQGTAPAAHPLSLLQSTSLENLSTDDPAGFSAITDLSTLIPWGVTDAGVSAFTTDTINGRTITALSSNTLAYLRTDTITGLRSFSALDYRFNRAISPDSSIIAISFSAKADSASSQPFSAILMNSYPDQELSGIDYNNFSANPYGTPGYSIRISPQGQRSSLQYGGANGGRFDSYQWKWWLPGSVGPTDGSASLVIGEGQEYPFSSWKSTARPMADTAWANYTWLVRPDGMELYKNDTLYGTMELPAYSYTAPGYTRYAGFKALRLAWQGQFQVSDLSVATLSLSEQPNRPPQIAFVNPQRDTAITAGSSFYLQAEARDSDGAIARVEFYANNQLLAACAQSPYAYSWPVVPEGTNEVTVVAVDNEGAVSVGKVIKIRTVDRVSVAR